jgi:hypothetical protein
MRHLFWILGLAAVWALANIVFEALIFPPAHTALHDGHLGIYLTVGWLGLIISFPYLHLLRAFNLSFHPAWFALTRLIWGTTVYLLSRGFRLIWRRRTLKSTSTA